MVLSRIIRSCSLDRRTDDIAEGIPNFSKWVRGQLIARDGRIRATAAQARSHPKNAYRSIGNGFIDEPIEICWPFSKEGCCVICWPDGPPNESAWREWSSDVKAGRSPTLPDGEGWFEGDIDSHIEKEEEVAQVKQNGRFKRLLIWLIR